MLVTEKQAEKMLCFRKVNPWCLGSKCMAWRWGDPGMNLPPMPDSYISEDLQGNRGYCGAAGRPLETE